MEDDLFVPIKPFDSDINQLNPRVLSDHAEIALGLPDGNNILAWNISNPKYHPYFSYGSTFKNSHLYVEKPYDERGLMQPWLRQKIDTQLETLTNNFVDQKFPIQVVIEGFDGLYNSIERRLAGLPYTIIRDKSSEQNTLSNISGIIVDTSQYWVLCYNISSVNYVALEDASKEKSMIYPWVKLKHKTSCYVCIVIAAHVNGCGSQFPVSGLGTLRNFMIKLSEHEKCDVIAIGDFNSPPDNVKKIFYQENISTPFNVMSPNYLTHCNPNSQAAKYDLAIVVSDDISDYRMLDLAHVSINSQLLVGSIMGAIDAHSNI